MELSVADVGATGCCWAVLDAGGALHVGDGGGVLDDDDVPAARRPSTR
ncbi:hypothetical protein [Fodinicola feengrottensis]|nr:hypothetical protein [Fodinicola feengrottensis]